MSVENNNNNTEKKGLFGKLKGLIGTKEERRARRGKKGKKAKVIIALVLVIAIAAGIGVPYYLKHKKGEEKTVNTAVATIGRVRSAISASGTIKPKDQYEVVSSVRGEVLSDTFEVGDVIKKGDILYELDKSDMSDTLEKAQMSMDKTKESYQDTMDSIEDLTVKAPISGVISQMFVAKGDTVSNGTKICEIIDKSKMTLTIPFNTSDVTYIQKGAIADVTMQNSFYKTTGVVTRVSTGSLVNELNVGVSYVDIEVENPGGITTNDTATAVVNGVACNSAGTFNYVNKKNVTAKVSGDVAVVYNDLGDQVYEGGTILQIESDNVDRNVTSANRSLREAQMSLNKTYEQLEDYTIVAKIDGTIIEKNIKAGDTLDNTNGNTTMCVIADMSVISFSIAVDELDIDKISLDQKVDITADALPNNRFVGHVNSININGTTSNGVTTYPVEVIVDNPDGLLPGMNVNAEIVIEEKNDVLVVPVSAIMRGNVVYVKEEDAKANNLKIITADDMKQGQKPDMSKAQAGKDDNAAEDKKTSEKSEEAKGKEDNTAPKADGEKSQGMSGYKPQGANGEMPQGMGMNRPEGMTGEKPQGMSGYKPQGSNSKAPQGMSKEKTQTSEEAKATETKTENKSNEKSATASTDKSNGNQSSMPRNMGVLRLGDIPEGFVAVRVETGINDDDFIEIISGLKEGVTVYVKSTSSTSQTNMRMPGMGGMSGMGAMGGMSGGARTMGGMSGGTRTMGGMSGGTQMRRN